MAEVSGYQGTLALTGERTVPGIQEENYWFPAAWTLYYRSSGHFGG